jgi:hypothetical protein
MIWYMCKSLNIGKTVKSFAVEARPVWGKTKLDAVLDKLGWNKVNTSAVERFNLTDHTSNSRKMRKTLRFSKRHFYHDAMSWITLAWYNFHTGGRRRKVQNPCDSPISLSARKDSPM